MTSQNNLDQVVLVDRDDRVIGQMDKVLAHRLPAQLHRAVSVYLFRRKGRQIELLVQQRSHKKIVGAGQWANTVCGNVRPGESYLDCARRRLREELGIQANDLSLFPLKKFIYQVQCNAEFGEHEVDQIFGGWYDGPTALSPDEVAKVEWVNWGDHHQWPDKKLAPWFKLMLSKDEIVQSLNNFIRKYQGEL